MFRKYGTTVDGASFREAVVDAVWQKGEFDPRYPNHRKDCCGAWMKRVLHGDTEQGYGWEIDHIKPEAEGGTDDLSNLQPLQWENNHRKRDTLPWSPSPHTRV